MMNPYKNNLKAFCLLLFLSLNTFAFYSQTNTPLSTSLNSNQERNILEDRATWIEVESERKVFSSTFLTPDKRIITHYSKQPVNYYNANNLLLPVNIIPTPTQKGISAVNQPNKVSLLNNGSVEINTSESSSITYSDNCKVNGKAIFITQIKHEGLNSTMSTNILGLTKTFEFRFNALKYNYVLNSPITPSSTDYIIEEEVTIPEGSKIEPYTNFGRQDKRGWLGSLLIVSNTGEEIGSIGGAICYDANNNFITAAYKYETINGKQKIKIIIPKSWINDPTRVYPITIDPLVTGPTATFGGPSIPSCISPASGKDSILVTIPANVSVTAMFVSGSFYANPFSTAIMNDGAMYFSTDCNTSSSFTTTAPAGLSPGTAYLTQFDLKNQLLCCKPQSCVDETFYLSMHVTRTVGGSGCNTTYIYHNPFSAYPFSAYIEGHTVEGFGPTWNVTPNNICSNVCDITATTYIRYGVPPFTITHPWMVGSISVGTPSGCSTGSTIQALPLTIPNCPWTCDTITTLSVPPPTIVDACGNILTGVNPINIAIKEVPTVSASPNPITICSGETFNTTLTPCIPTSVVNWSGNSTNGTGTSISETLVNTSSTISTTTYQVYAINNTCESDTITVTVNTVPLPNANFTSNPQPVIISNPVVFSDNSSIYGGNAISWYWSFGDGSFDINQNPTHIYTSPGTYTVCLAMQTTEGCLDTICEEIEVIPAELILPNVVTPNGDNMNDALYFKYLEFFGTNNLKVYNRWGMIIYEKDNYLNDWIPKNVLDGTYYYVLTVENGESYTSFLQVIQ